MTDGVDEEPTQIVGAVPERLLELQQQARAAGLTADTGEDGFDEEYPILRIQYPEARGFRSVPYDEDDASHLKGTDLANIRFLPDTQGFTNISTGRIEVQVRVRNLVFLKRVPGYEILDEPHDSAEDEDDVLEVRLDSKWRLAVEKDPVRLELSPASDEFRAIRGVATSPQRILTLKIDGATHQTSEESLQVFRTLGDSFFFDLDVRYNVVVDEMTLPRRTFGVRPRRMAAPAEFPENRYPAQPASLYRYGRSAQGLPLLSFLAFYQVLEFFFPIFTQEEVTRRVQQTLRSPRFDSTDEVSVLRLIEAIRPTIKFGVPEREQLRAAIRKCLATETIREFVTDSARAKDHFCSRTQSIPGLQPLQLESGNDLRDQVADRIYDIRCRIVHTKSEGGDSGVELLLPSGPEARSLAPDIDLVRLAAQEALVAGASPLSLR